MKSLSSLLRSSIVIAGIALMFGTGCADPAKWNTTDGEPLKDLSYGESYRNTYDLYLPANKKP